MLRERKETEGEKVNGESRPSKGLQRYIHHVIDVFLSYNNACK